MPALQRMRGVSAPAYHGLESFGVFLSQAVELHLVILESLFLLGLSAKERPSQLRLQTVVVHASVWSLYASLVSASSPTAAAAPTSAGTARTRGLGPLGFSS